MFRRSVATATTLSALLTSAVAQAHPGHGTIDASQPAHYVVEPLHAAPWIGLVAVAVAAAMYARGYWKKNR
ncbi:hypothetical protein Mal4_08530 [Maioricimonas rarisocia]|uniref:Cobalt transport protein CbiN n=1 Tax=Maioricimonas rarisocia TaxID=2528026 RepID=A0A517Z268_9PLAN|nr:hypothetical protein [Maioricimonas rarisocia]QDU36566.1 hypothetical protein Mal4_08530 [Maioricimonas rarisocia]